MSNQRVKPNEFTKLVTLIGLTVITWSGIEVRLDAAVAILYHDCKGGDLDGVIPASLKRKVTFVRRCLNRIESLADFKQDGLALMARITAASERRHDLIHGVVMGLDLQGESFPLARIKYLNTTHDYQEASFAKEQIPDFLAELVSLASGMTNFVRRIAGRFCTPQ